MSDHPESLPNWEAAADALRRAGFAAWHRPPCGVKRDEEGRYRANHFPGTEADCPACKDGGWGRRIRSEPLPITGRKEGE